MAYTSIEGTIILKSTRHGVLASIREGIEWRELLREFAILLVQNKDTLMGSGLVLDFGWRELDESQFDSILRILAEHNLSCAGVLSTSLLTRTAAESRGYRAIIGRLGLAQHHGRRLKTEALAAEPKAISEPPAEPASDKSQDEVKPCVTAKPISELPPPGISSGLVIQPVSQAMQPQEPLQSEPSRQLISLQQESEPEVKLLEVEPKLDESLKAVNAICPSESASDLAGASEIFDSSDPAIANLPLAFVSEEAPSTRMLSSSCDSAGLQPSFEDEEPTLYLRKTLRSGQKVVFAGNVILLGDLNPGAQIEADGDVIVLGQLRGSVHAGCEGDSKATIVTSAMKATQLRIADHLYQPDSQTRFFRKTPQTGTLRARLQGTTVVLEALGAR